MPLVVDIERARVLAGRLHCLFAVTGEGIHGQKEMPEDAPPNGVERGSLDHLLFITLTVAIDYQRDAHALWNAARRTFEDLKVRYLFEPASVHAAGNAKVVADMQRYRLSQKPVKDARIWQQVAISFVKKWGGDPLNFRMRSTSDTLPLDANFRDLRARADGPLGRRAWRADERRIGRGGSRLWRHGGAAS